MSSRRPPLLRLAAWATLVFLATLIPPMMAAAFSLDPTDSEAEAIRALEGWIRREAESKEIPALSIAIVDDQRLVWSQGFGFADSKRKIPATGDTVYRVGSVSKLFADLAAMRLVDEGQLDLDEPISTYLPNLHPKDPFGKPFTLRQMMSHRSGLVRETPDGSYFDDEPPALEKVVESLNSTSLIYAPGSRTKYSNAAVTAIGYLVERKRNERFAQVVDREILQPLGMTKSSFDLLPALKKDLAQAEMWTYHGRTFPAPVFDFGIAPAGNLYSTVNDLGKFLSGLFRDGGGIVKPETLASMYQEPYPGGGFGLGFAVGAYEGKRRVGHGGAVFGYATELSALPDEKLGVAVVASKDCANTVTRRIASTALSFMLALKAKKPLPKLVSTEPIPVDRFGELAGYYTDGVRTVELMPQARHLIAMPHGMDRWYELREQGAALIPDGVLGYGGSIVPLEKALIFNGKRLDRAFPEKPAEAPSHWKGLIGEYGWDRNILYILEHEGKLHALIEWFFFYPLTEESDHVFAFPDSGLYEGEKLIFKRDDQGRASEVEAASIIFPRREIDGENGETFQVKPIRAIDELRADALKAQPPEERGDFRKPDLVDLGTLDPAIKLDIRYSTANNFMGTPFYKLKRAFMQRPAAEAVLQAHKSLKAYGYGLLIHDAYRPWHVTKMFWDGVEAKHHGFVANPARGSRHNRGCAVDLSLYDLKTGQPVKMVGGYDEFSDRSAPLYPGGTSLERWHRRLLWRAMTDQGFTVNESEWWHFDYEDWPKYPILNVPFEELDALIGGKR